MDNATFEILRYAITLAVVVIVYSWKKYLVPLVESQVGKAKFDKARQWTEMAVLAAQQALKDKTGEDRKKYVTAFLRGTAAEAGMQLTDEQIDVLIESAVKEMKMVENQAAASISEKRQPADVQEILVLGAGVLLLLQTAKQESFRAENMRQQITEWN